MGLGQSEVVKQWHLIILILYDVGSSLVKIYSRIIKKRYLKQKHTYQHRHISIPVPSKFHEQIEPFLGHNLEMMVTHENNKLTITLIAKSNPAKTFLHDENRSAKTP